MAGGFLYTIKKQNRNPAIAVAILNEERPLLSRWTRLRGHLDIQRSFLSGTPETIRTSDPSLRRRMLYPLSYWGILNSAILQCAGGFVKKMEYRRRTNNRLGLGVSKCRMRSCVCCRRQCRPRWPACRRRRSRSFGCGWGKGRLFCTWVPNGRCPSGTRCRRLNCSRCF